MVKTIDMIYGCIIALFSCVIIPEWKFFLCVICLTFSFWLLYVFEIKVLEMSVNSS